MELVYHSMNGRQPSPFDRVTRNLVRDEDALFASPYLSLPYFKGLCRGTKSWHLLTDLVEMFKAHERSDRSELKEFILENAFRIRDVPGLHSKVTISPRGISVGSANLTIHGVTKRVEMASVSNEPGLIKEAQDWFWKVWALGGAPTNSVLKVAMSTPEPRAGPRTEASRKPVVDSFVEGDESGKSVNLERFLEVLRKELKNIGFTVHRDRHRTTLRVYVGKAREYPLLNPIRASQNGREYLLLVASSVQHDPTNGRALTGFLETFPDGDDSWFSTSQRPGRNFDYHGQFVLPLNSESWERALQVDLIEFREPLQRIYEFLRVRPQPMSRVKPSRRRRHGRT